MAQTAAASPVIVVANMVDEQPLKPTSSTEPASESRLAALHAQLEPDAAQLKAAAMGLFCVSLLQLFTLHGFLGCIASAVVVFYAEGSPLGTAHAARFAHPFAVATAFSTAGALAATMIVSFALVPSMPVSEMMSACQEAQQNQGSWPKQHALPMMYGFHHEANDPFGSHIAKSVQYERAEEADLTVHPDLMVHMGLDPPKTAPEAVVTRPVPATLSMTADAKKTSHEDGEKAEGTSTSVEATFGASGSGMRRMQEMAIENCDELVEYMSHYLPMVLMINMMVQAGLLVSACSMTSKAGILWRKARSLGAPAL